MNAVRVEVPQEAGAVDRYENARRILDGWIADGAVVLDDAPTLTVYRMTYKDDDGVPRATTGVLGALAIADGGLLPHEHTTPKAKDDRLNLLRACRTNVSPIWCLSPAPGLSALLPTDGPPDAVAVDDEGAHHEAWVVRDADAIAAVTASVASTPVIVADGHHRYEVARAYRDERRAATGDEPGDYDSVLALVVELDDEQLSVGAIHRLIKGLPAGVDIAAVFARHFVLEPADNPRALALVTRDGAWHMTPRPGTDAAAEQPLDSSRVMLALADLPPHDLVFQHGRDIVVNAVREGEADAALLLRPATVDQIAETGRSGVRMPPKTTFFWPKPRTGLVYRPVRD